jgi:hypothetical protein
MSAVLSQDRKLKVQRLAERMPAAEKAAFIQDFDKLAQRVGTEEQTKLLMQLAGLSTEEKTALIKGQLESAPPGTDEQIYYDVANSFSHWTHERTWEDRSVAPVPVLVCDIQGVCNEHGYNYTDPAIHSTNNDGRYGRTDRGQKGIERFYQSHQCNEICLKLKLPMRNCKEVRSRYKERHASELSNTGSLSQCNSNTSNVSVDPTDHLRRRMQERGVSTSLLQRTRKYGQTRRQPNGTLEFRGRDMRYVTARDGKVGITCMPDWKERQRRPRDDFRDQGEWGAGRDKRQRVLPPPQPRAAPSVFSRLEGGHESGSGAGGRGVRDKSDDKRQCVACGDVGCGDRMQTCKVHRNTHFHTFCVRVCPSC